MGEGDAHLVARCGHCGAPQPLTLAAPVGACGHCGHTDPVDAAVRKRLDELRGRLARRERAPLQLTQRAVLEGDFAYGVGLIALVVSWLLLGGFALYIALAHDVPLGDFVTGGEPAQQWWLLWSLALGLALSVFLLELGVARIRAVSADALPAPPVGAGGPRCRCCAAELDDGGALRRCGSCDADNVVIGDRYRRVQDDLDRALDDLEAQVEGDLKKRIGRAGTISMAGAVAPFVLLFLAPVVGLFTPGSPGLWLVPGAVALLAIAAGVFARARRLPIEAIELTGLGTRVHLGAPVDETRVVCAQLVLPGGAVSLLAKSASKKAKNNTAEDADFALATRRRDGDLEVVIYDVAPAKTPAADAERDRLVAVDLDDRAEKDPPAARRVFALIADGRWRTFAGDDLAPHLRADVRSGPLKVGVRGKTFETSNRT